ncbi:hypothetical protein AAULH_03793 [Lactobacillus helveticus MTCC 5463]|nr:hypothetical protein AAULH_03793 [Lactobacillus helveticus MTCC 5463]
MDYQKILDQLVSGELKEYKVEPEDAFDLQKLLEIMAKDNILPAEQKEAVLLYIPLRTLTIE